MSASYHSRQEQCTARFYEWELLGRGWLHASEPIQLEPPFTPFFGYSPFLAHPIDDGAVPTVLSRVADLFSSKSTKREPELLNEINYTPFSFEDDSSLIRHIVTFPKGFTPEPHAVLSFLTMLSYIKQPVSIELHATKDRIQYCIVCRESDAGYLVIQLKTYFPQVGINASLELFDELLDSRLPIATVDFGLEQECIRPIAVYQGKQPDALIPLLAHCQHLSANDTILIQVLFNGVVNPWHGSMLRSVQLENGAPFFENAPEMLPLVKEKIQSPLFAATMRIAVQSDEYATAAQILDTLSFAIRTQARSSANTLIPLTDESYTITQRALDISFRQSHRFGMLLNLGELAQFCHFPAYAPVIGKLYAQKRKTKAVPALATGHPYVLGTNEYNGHVSQVTLSENQRIRHMHLIGATGTGKSTLLTQLALQDIGKGNGFAVIDPHGDLIDEIMSRIPEERHHDVILIDPSDTAYATGINILEAHSDAEKEVLSSDVVASFKKLSTSWGDQMNTVLANAILALLESPHGGTLHDLRRFLVEPSFRAQTLATLSDPAILYYWQKEYPFLKTNSIGPILTRLDTFLRPKVIRSMVIQKRGINFNTVLEKQQILLVKLSQGLIGAENSYLLGTLILSKLHQAAFARQQSGVVRHPFFVYLDEFHHFITPSVKEMLTGVRKYAVGLVLAHQDIGQLQKEDADMVSTVLNHTYTRIVFRTGEQDAKKLCEGFQSFDATDIQNLAQGEAIIRIEQQQYDCSLNTFSLEAVPDNIKHNTIAAIQKISREKYGATKEEIVQMLSSSLPVISELSTVPQKTPIQPPKEVVTKQRAAEKSSEPVSEPLKQEKEEAIQQNPSVHRYLQLLIKKMAESKGYTATLEATLPDGTGQVDVLLTKEGKTIAVEVCHTTHVEWEMHNIEKCLKAGYNTVVSLSGDTKQIQKIKKQCESSVTVPVNQRLFFLTPDLLFELLDEQPVASISQSQEQIIKGYRVQVSYEAISQEEAQRKRSAVAKVVADALRKSKK